MMADTRHTRSDSRRLLRRWSLVVCAAAFFALVGCKNDRGVRGNGVSRGNDPLIAGPNLIPKQNVPIPDRATGPNGRRDPLTTPTGGKAGYTDDPERFKGTVLPGESNTPAALAGRINDGEELKIDDGGGVTLTPAGGTLPGGTLQPPANVEPLYAELEKLGVKREDRVLERDGAQWVFRASVVLTAQGAKRQYTGMGDTAAEAVRNVLKQLSTDQK